MSEPTPPNEPLVQPLTESEAPQLGDAGTFDQIYGSYRPLVRSICVRMLRNPVDAEDAAQEAFIHIFRKIHTFRGDAALSTWLYRLTKNTVLMQLRDKRSHMVSFEEMSEDQDIMKKGCYATTPPLGGSLDRFDLQAAIDLLSRRDKRSFVLHDLLGYCHKDIGEILGCSVGASKSQLHRARRRLQKFLGRGSSRHKKQTFHEQINGSR
jgi:RNA polymerase sigma-70 factor (ECF subfamily)